MNKLNLLIATLGLLFLISCKNNSSTESKAKTPEMDVVEETVMDEVPLESDIDFEKALEAFEMKEYQVSAGYIDNAIGDIREESKDMDSAVKEKVGLSEVTLKGLSTRIKAGKIKDLATLERAFAEAEMLIAHDYIVFSDYYFVDNPKKSMTSTQSALDRIENAIEKLEGEAKADAQKLSKEIRESLKRGDKETNRLGNKAGRNIVAWLGKHKIAL